MNFEKREHKKLEKLNGLFFVSKFNYIIIHTLLYYRLKLLKQLINLINLCFLHLICSYVVV